MLQPLNLLLGSGGLHAALTCTGGTASGDRIALIPMPWGASADAQGNAPLLGRWNVEEHGKGIESPGSSLFLGPDLPRLSLFPPMMAAVAVAITFSSGGQEDQDCLPLTQASPLLSSTTSPTPVKGPVTGPKALSVL